MVLNVGEVLKSYRNTLKALDDGAGATDGAVAPGGGFGNILGNMLGDTVDTLKKSENVSLAAVQGKASINEVITAVSSAEAALQTVVTIRDRVIAAYQELMRSAV
ncbi:MAG: flagellar hook-basal body complex protein FliE [Alphaproteobacteria bacterium]|nr:flagellar hook-basal body complex protein FliE [Alphaproteobacteria bacterium]